MQWFLTLLLNLSICICNLSLSLTVSQLPNPFVSVSPSIWQSVSQSELSNYLSICLSQSLYLSMHLMYYSNGITLWSQSVSVSSISPCQSVSHCLSIHPYIYPSICMSVCIYLSIHPSIHPPEVIMVW